MVGTTIAPWMQFYLQAAVVEKGVTVFAAAATSVEHASDTVRLVLPAGPGVIATVGALCAAETACCAQARFLLEVTAGQVTLTVEAHGTAGLLDILLPADTPIRS